MAKKTALAKPLITAEEIAKNFVLVANELEKFDAISKAVDIKDEESLTIAENNAAQIKVLLDRTEAARKALGDPHYQTHKSINQYAKGISDKLDAYKQRVTLAVTNWRTVQEAHKRAELEAKQKELQVIEDEKTAEMNRLTQLTNTILARLYGGKYVTKKGEQYSDGCYTQEECDKLAEVLSRSFPGEEQFKHFPKKRNDILSVGLKAIRSQKIDLVDRDSDIPGVRAAANTRIKENIKNAGLIVEKTGSTMARKIASETKKEVREGEKEIKEAAKGTRKILKFRIINEEEVTREYLSVDESKIRTWVEGQTTEIKEGLKRGSQPISGVQFYVETVYASR